MVGVAGVVVVGISHALRAVTGRQSGERAACVHATGGAGSGKRRGQDGWRHMAEDV